MSLAQLTHIYTCGQDVPSSNSTLTFITIPNKEVN